LVGNLTDVKEKVTSGANVLLSSLKLELSRENLIPPLIKVIEK
jgi:hypothetical protein